MNSNKCEKEHKWPVFLPSLFLFVLLFLPLPSYLDYHTISFRYLKVAWELYRNWIFSFFYLILEASSPSSTRITITVLVHCSSISDSNLILSNWWPQTSQIHWLNSWLNTIQLRPVLILVKLLKQAGVELGQAQKSSMAVSYKQLLSCK